MEAFSSPIIATIAEAILVVDIQGRIVHFNAHANEFFGYSDEELRGSLIEMLIPERYRRQHINFRAAFAGESKPRMMGSNRDLYGLRKDGSEFPVEVGLGPLQQGAEQYVVVSLADISKRKQVEFQARWCESIVKSSEDAIVSLTLDGVVTSWNPKAQAMFGYSAEEIVSSQGLLLVPEERKEELHSIIGRIRQGEVVSNFETVRRHKDGTPIDVSITISPIRDEQGKPVGLSGALRDITARKRVEHELAQLAEERAELLRARTADLHLTEDILQERTAELRTTLNRQAEEQRRRVEEERRRISLELHDEIGQMLTALNFNLEMVRRKLADPGAAQPALTNAMQITADIVKGVRSIVNQLHPPQLDELGLIAALRWLLDNVRKSSFLTIALTENLGPRRLAAETEMGCFRIVQESLTNILRHSSAAQVEVNLIHTASTLQLSIRDDGVGFELADGSDEGYGIGHLGLLGMRERANGLGGTFRIATSPGQGCTVSIEIPLDYSVATSS